MHQLTHRNHFRFGYNGEAFNFRTSPDDSWWVTYGKSEWQPRDWRTECIETARLIRSNTNLPIHVMFSGGIDSEVVVRSFHAAGIPICAAILRFKDDLNLHDIRYAVDSCEALAIPYRFYDLDLLKFWEAEVYEYAARTYCLSPQLCSTMWLVDQIDGYPVMGSAECYLVKRLPEGYQPGISPYERSPWDMYEKELIAAWYRHFQIRDREGAPGFFQYNPENMYAFLVDKTIQDLVNDRIPGKCSSMSSKLGIYQRYWPELVSREKYTGFELVQEQDAPIRARLAEMHPGTRQVHRTEYNDLVGILAYHGD